MSDPRVIKRYANRKLYDTQHSCYVTLDQIAQMVRDSEDVRIIDNNSKEDLTSVTLAQIIFEEEKKRRLLPLQGLKAIIQTSGESIQDFVKQISQQVDEQVVKVFRRDKDGKVVEAVVGEEEPGLTAEDAAADASGLEDDIAASVERAGTTAAFREFLESSQRRLDEWQTQVDVQVRKVVDNIHPMPRIQKDLQNAVDKIAELERRLTALEKS